MAATITYWRGRGRAEAIRLCLAMAGVEWKDGPFLQNPEDLKQLRDSGKLLFQQAPLLEWEGKNLVQVGAILRHIGRKYNMYGKNLDENVQVDMLFEGCVDFGASFLGFSFGDDESTLKKIKTEVCPRYMPVYEKILSESKSGYLVGDSVTIADVKLLEVLLNFPERCPDAFDGYVKTKEFFERMKNLPQMSKYLNGPQRFGPNDTAYVASVKKTLGW